MPPPIRSLTQARFRDKHNNVGKIKQPWSEAAELVQSEQQQSCQEAFKDRPSFLHAFSFRIFFLPPFLILSSPSFYCPLLFWLSYSLSPPISLLSGSLPPSRPPCHSAHLGCLVELGTSVPVRGAQWGPVEDTKGGLLQLPVTLRPTQQLFGVYSSVLNPHTQPHHKGTSLAPAQRIPLHTPSSATLQSGPQIAWLVQIICMCNVC